jgi:hypothetical protein
MRFCSFTNMSKELLQNEIGSVAQSFEGQQEIQGNKGFKEVEFQKKMEEVGFYMGAAWCSYFAELVITQAYKNRKLDYKRIAQLFSGSAVKTWSNFSAATDFETSQTPEIGDVVIWQSWKYGKAHWTGHAGIVVGVYPGHVVTMEGNTNSQGGREGIEVARKIRNYDFNKTAGLRMLGFIKVAK